MIIRPRIQAIVLRIMLVWARKHWLRGRRKKKALGWKNQRRREGRGSRVLGKRTRCMYEY